MRDHIVLMGRGNDKLVLEPSYGGHVIVNVGGKCISVNKADLRWSLDDLAPEPTNEAHLEVDSVSKHEPFKFQHQELAPGESWSSIGREKRRD